ncbi:MAG: type 4a pilus biogenesis protein PilO [candidate division WOR-3 bacterium]
MKKIRGSVIVLFIAILIGVGMYFTVLKEKNQKIAIKQKEYKDLELKLSKTMAIVQRKQEAIRKHKIIAARWNQAQKMLPKEEKISDLVKTLTERATKNEVKIKHFKPVSRTQKEKYSEIVIQMEVEGGYHNIAGFMAELNNMQRIVNVRNLKLSPITIKEEKEEKFAVSATFELLTYITKGGKVEG